MSFYSPPYAGFSSFKEQEAADRFAEHPSCDEWLEATRREHDMKCAAVWEAALQRKIKELTEEAATTKDSLAALTTVVTSLATTSGSAEEVAKAKEILLSIKEEVMEKETDPPSDVSLLIGHIAALEQLFDTSAKKLASGSANKENEVPTVTNKKILTDSSNANQNAQPALERKISALTKQLADTKLRLGAVENSPSTTRVKKIGYNPRTKRLCTTCLDSEECTEKHTDWCFTEA